MFEEALKLRKEYKLSVVPTAYREKRPSISWEPYYQHHATEEELRNWFTGDKPPGIAIVTGLQSSGNIVVDFDPFAVSSAEQLCEEAEAHFKCKFPTTCRVRTAGGGWHDHYKVTTVVPTCVIFQGQHGKIEIRGEKSIAVMPPTIARSKRNPGNREGKYTFIRGLNHRVQWEDTWLAKVALEKQQRVSDDTLPPEPHPDEAERIVKENWSKLSSIAVRLFNGDIPTDDRSQQIYGMACEFVRCGIYDQHILSAMIYLSCMHYDKFGGRNDGWLHSWRCAGKVLHEINVKAKENPSNKVLPVIDVVDIPESSPVNFIVDSMLPRGGYLMILAGRPKQGKTTILLHLIACIAKGVNFSGLNTNPVKILGVFREDEPEDIRAELKKYGLNSGGKVILPDYDAIDDIIDWESILSTAIYHNCQLVIVDPLISATRIKSGKTGYEDLYPIVQSVRQKAHQMGITVIAVTHSPKGNTVIRELSEVIDSPIGSTAYAAAADGVASFGQHPNNPKHKRLLGHGRKKVSFDLAFYWEEGVYRPVQPDLPNLSKRTLELLSNERKPWTAKQIRKKLSRNNNDVMTALNQLKTAGMVTEDTQNVGQSYWEVKIESSPPSQ